MIHLGSARATTDCDTGCGIKYTAAVASPPLAMVNSSLSTLIDAATARFKSTWDHEATHCGYSPGRVNLIGDHVDYNDGFSLPMAIPAYVVMVGALSPNEQFTIETMSSDFEERTVRFTLDTLNTPSAPCRFSFTFSVTKSSHVYI